MVVVGGWESTFGSIVGAALITWLQYDLLKNIPETPLVGPSFCPFRIAGSPLSAWKTSTASSSGSS